jgi:mitochondrial import receptor subunit TOM40
MATIADTPLDASSTTSSLAFLRNNAIVSSVNGLLQTFQERRAKLGLSNPGTIENIAREVQRDVLLTNLMFTGLRAELTKVFNLSPLFHVSHQFAASGDRLSPYTFNALYGTNNVRNAALMALRSCPQWTC